MALGLPINPSTDALRRTVGEEPLYRPPSAFPHEDPEFPDLVRIASRDRGVSEALVEKDYWVTHTLWALAGSGLDVWFKGGTSLSKGFNLIERFSEDLDLRLEAGRVAGFPEVSSWTSTNKGPCAARRAFYEHLGGIIAVPSARIEVETIAKQGKDANYRVLYPGSFVSDIQPPMRPFVLLEVGRARVAPYVDRPITSWVHDVLRARGLAYEFRPNEPAAIRCVHPLVTLLDKLDAISTRFEKGRAPEHFIRHYDDAARIIDAVASSRDAAFEPHGVRRDELDAAYEAIAPMYWGPRRPLSDVLAIIRDWVTASRLAR